MLRRTATSEFDEDGRDDVVFHLGKGGALCRAHKEQEGLKVRVSFEAFHALRVFAVERPLIHVTDYDLSEECRGEIEGLLLGYLRYHVAGLQYMRSMKTLPVFSPEHINETNSR